MAYVGDVYLEKYILDKFKREIYIPPFRRPMTVTPSHSRVLGTIFSYYSLSIYLPMDRCSIFFALLCPVPPTLAECLQFSSFQALNSLVQTPPMSRASPIRQPQGDIHHNCAVQVTHSLCSPWLQVRDPQALSCDQIG
jgi:hypothetical protein